MGFWRGKRVLLTGHTGFKGAWLHFWLKQLGAHVQGLSLPPATDPSLFELLGNDGAHPKGIVDIRDRVAVLARVKAINSEIVFHLAAQPLVRAGYREPVDTFETNVQGTVNLLDSLRSAGDVRSIVVVTTDKVYENPELAIAFSETDPLGGHDPYSASKAASDIVTASYRRSFFLPRGIGLATARAGNVIGGGDWAADRLIPDAVRALTSGKALDIRRPDAVRPWQHVLEPLGGYMLLAEKLWNEPEAGPAYNFGPDPASTATVREILELSVPYFELGNIGWGNGSDGPHEAGLLTLDSTRAADELGFKPRFSLRQTIDRTWRWYRGLEAGKSAADLCLADLIAFEAGQLDIGRRAFCVSTRFELIETPLAGLTLLRRKRLGDHRGYLMRLFDAEELTEFGWTGPIAQINETGTGERGTVRGFHYQRPPFCEAKLIACTRGRILDVAVDIRKGSPTFLEHFAVELSEGNDLSFLIPQGFAHGYQALTSDVRMLYAHSAPFRAEAEAGFNVADPKLRIEWPLPVANLSARDQGFTLLTDQFDGVDL